MEEVLFDYEKLRGRIRERYKTQDEFASAIGIGRVSLSKRLNNRLDFSRTEMMRACKALGISEEEMTTYFFAREVQKAEPPKFN